MPLCMNDVSVKHFNVLFLQCATMEVHATAGTESAVVRQSLVAENVKEVSGHVTYSLCMYSLGRLERLFLLQMLSLFIRMPVKVPDGLMIIFISPIKRQQTTYTHR